ncbi:MAG: D-alanyl-D-alanine carboxypeptidase [Oscillospiraceae bacterium]|nr:D-alanyl-D-alanine carboxypeptidase [Oscillospiraceae bacterium]
MKAKGLFCLAMGLAIAVSAQAAEPLMTQPLVEAKAAVVMEALTGRVVFWQNGDDPLPMASTTKIMATLLALEEKNLDEAFVADADAIRVEGSSMGLREGDTVTLRTLCYGMMLASGNDAANAAAVRCCGSIPAFVEQMNRRAVELGMKNTCFVTPSGLDGEGHKSTAYDMALLMREALKLPDFREIASAKTARLEYGNPPYARTLTNHNKLLWNCDGVIAGKTGFTKTAGRCLVSAAERNGMTLICVTLGCPDDWNVHSELYERGFALLQPFAPADLANGVTLPVVGEKRPVGVAAEERVVLPLTVEESELMETKLLLPPFVYAPVGQGESLGRLECRIGGTLVYSCRIVAAEQVVPDFVFQEEKKNFWQMLWNKKE